jgi:hypothetical protein
MNETMRRQLKQPVLMVISILVFSGASAFGPTQHHVANIPIRGDLTRLSVHAGNSWARPIVNVTVKSTMQSTRLPAVRTASGIASSSVSQDATKEPMMSDLEQQLEHDSDAIANNNSLVPIMGGLAVLMLLTGGASVSGLL